MAHIILEIIGNFWVIAAGTVAICAILATIGQWKMEEIDEN